MVFFQGLALPWFGSPFGDFLQFRTPKAAHIVIYSIESFSRSSGPLVLWFFGPLVLVLWCRGPLVLWLLILWSLVAVFGWLKILPVTAFGASEKTGPLQSTTFVAFEMLRLLRSQETANTVFAVLERLRML